jgi:hypothetical protein
VLEPAVFTHAIVQRVLPGVPERRVAQIMREAYGFSERFVQIQGQRYRAPDLGHFHRMRQARAIHVALVIDEYLRLVDQAAKGTGMNYAIPITLELTAILWRGFGISAPAALLVMRGVPGKHALQPKCVRSVLANTSSE